MPLVIRSNVARSFGLSRKLAVTLALKQEYEVPASRIDFAALTSIRAFVADGSLTVVDSDPAHGLTMQRPVTARRELHVVLGTGSPGSITLPNGSTLHALKLGGVTFTLGNGNIDAANVTDLLAAFLAALNASTDLAATGLAVATSSLLAGDERALVVLNGDDVPDWTAFLAATSLLDDQGEALGSPAMTYTAFTPATSDTPLASTNVPVIVTHTVVAGDVTRGYIALDTGLSGLTTSFALMMRRAGSPILHNGKAIVKSGRFVLVENDGNTDFQAADVVTLIAFGND